MRLKKFLNEAKLRLKRSYAGMYGADIGRKKYITELSMKADTQIEWSKRGEADIATIIITPPQTGKFIDEYQSPDIFTFHVHRVNRKASDFSRGFPFKKDRLIMIALEFSDNENNVVVMAKKKGVALKLFAALEHIFKTKILNSKHDKIVFTGDFQHKKLYNQIAKRLQKSGEYYREKVVDDEVFAFIRKDSLSKIPHHSKIYK